MATKAFFENFSRTNLRLEPDINLPNISDDIQQVLSRPMGWDYNNGLWIPILVDTEGRLLVSTSPTQSSIPAISGYSFTTGNQVMFTSNPNRRQFIFQNTGLNDVLVFYGDGSFLTSRCLVIPPNVILIEDVFTGQIRGAASTGTSTGVGIDL